MLDNIIDKIQTKITNLFKKLFNYILKMTLDILKWTFKGLKKPFNTLITKLKNKLVLIKDKLYLFYKKHFKNGIKHKKLIFRLSSTLAVIIIIFSISFLYPKVTNHYKSTNNILTFVEYDTNKKIEVNEPKQEEPVQQVSNEPAPVDNSYGWPTEGNYYISQYFSSWHNGIDIAGCGYGSNIYATFRGQVVTTSYTSTNGNYIVILDDNGIYQMYAHLSAIYVGSGQRVDKGTVIGAMGASGYVTGTHLHYSTWHGYPHYGGYPFNPYSLY